MKACEPDVDGRQNRGRSRVHINVCRTLKKMNGIQKKMKDILKRLYIYTFDRGDFRLVRFIREDAGGRRELGLEP